MKTFSGTKKARRHSSPRAPAAASVAKAVSNPFEARSNKSVRFDVLGRRVKGAERNVAVARTKAAERRKDSLSAELNAIGRTNSFIDRRFGEHDAGIDAETRNLVRLQKERRRQLRTSKKRGKYALDDPAPGDGGGDTETLTHFGRALSDVIGVSSVPRPGPGGFGSDDEDEDGDGGRGADVTAAHFGGGDGLPEWRGRSQRPAWMAEGSPAALAAEAARPRTYKEIMEEVISKSKAARAAAAEEKAAMEFRLQQLDGQVGQVLRLLGGKKGRAPRLPRDDDAAGVPPGSALSAAAVSVAPKPDAAAKAAPSRAGAAAPTAAAGAPLAVLAPATRGPTSSSGGSGVSDFDSLVLALSRESRAAAALDRSKTPEEAAREEAARLRELEELRRARMTGGGGSGEVGSSSSAPAPAAADGGDDLGPDLTAGRGLTARQKRRRESGASILQYARQPGGEDYEDKEDDGEGEEAEADEEDEDSSSSDDEEEEEFDEDEYDEEDEEGGGEDVGSNGDSEEEGVSALRLATAAALRAQAGLSRPPARERRPASDSAAPPAAHRALGASGSSASSFAEMPYSLAVPQSLAAWHALVERHCAPLLHAAPPGAAAAVGQSSDATPPSPGPAAAEAAVAELVRRITACNSVVLAAQNKYALERLYAVLLEDVAATAEGGGVGSEWRLEALCRQLFALSQERALQAGAAAAWRALVGTMQARVQGALEAPQLEEGGAGGGAWLRPGEVALLRVAAAVFPTSDFRHPIVTPLQLLLGQLLCQAPVRTPADVAQVRRAERRRAPLCVSVRHLSSPSLSPPISRSSTSASCST